MKIYNVLFESHYEGEDISSYIFSFTKREDAVKSLERNLSEEISESGLTKNEIAEILVRDGDDFFCIYHDDSQSDWKFRCTIYETELD